MTRYFIGIDNGSQSSKVTVFDELGTVVASGRQVLRPNDSPRPGVVEHPGDDLWDSIGAAARQAMERFEGDLADIVGVGLCTIRFCRALLTADGTLASPVMSWMDGRVSRPYTHTDDKVAYVTTSSGYISHRMTGEFTDTAANYAGLWPLDSDTMRWSADDAVIAAFGAPRDMLFDLVQPGDVLGHITPAAAAHTGIPAGLPVIATANDKAVEALGCGLRSTDTLLVSLGTYVAGMTAGTRNVRDAVSFWTNYASSPHEYLYESFGVRRGMWTVSWVRDLFGEETEELLNAEAAKIPAGSEGLMTVLDWLAPTDAPYRKGTFLGFDGRQGRFHMYRSILEGLALTLHGHGTRVAEELGTSYRRTVISGGGSNSDVMMQIFADVFGVPAERSEVNNAAGLGAAICAAVGLGVYGTYDKAIAAMVRPGVTFAPDPANHALYQRMGKVYAQITAHTDEIYKESYDIFG